MRLSPRLVNEIRQKQYIFKLKSTHQLIKDVARHDDTRTLHAKRRPMHSIQALSASSFPPRIASRIAQAILVRGAREASVRVEHEQDGREVAAHQEQVSCDRQLLIPRPDQAPKHLFWDGENYVQARQRKTRSKED